MYRYRRPSKGATIFLVFMTLLVLVAITQPHKHHRSSFVASTTTVAPMTTTTVPKVEFSAWEHGGVVTTCGGIQTGVTVAPNDNLGPIVADYVELHPSSEVGATLDEAVHVVGVSNHVVLKPGTKDVWLIYPDDVLVMPQWCIDNASD